MEFEEAVERSEVC